MYVTCKMFNGDSALTKFNKLITLWLNSAILTRLSEFWVILLVYFSATAELLLIYYPIFEHLNKILSVSHFRVSFVLVSF